MNAGRPPEGIYLDAALADVRERTLARIDRRRRHRLPILIGTVIAASLVVGTAATVLVTSHPWMVNPSSRTLYQLYCQQGNDINGTTGATRMSAYFAVSFYYPTADKRAIEIDPVAACSTIWTSALTRWAAATDPADTFAANVKPERPNALFGSDSLTPATAQVGAIFSPGDYDGATPPMGVCVRPDERGAAVYVISANAGETHVSKRQWQVRCEINPGFIYRAPNG